MTSGGRQTPGLSVVLATDAFETIRPVLSALRRQRQPHEIEPVIVLPAAAIQTIRHEELRTLAPARIVSVDTVCPLAPARAAGVGAATSPIVFIGETHTYPQEGWAEALLAAFEGPWSAVVPAIANANPSGAVSWAGYLFDYGRWGTTRSPGEMSDPLLYNTAYRREVLLGLGNALAAALDPSEELLWPRLSAAGHRAAFAPDALILHLNVARFGDALLEKFSVGSVLGSTRAARWSPGRRLLYILASPLIPIVLVARVIKGIRDLKFGRLPFGTKPVIALSAVAKALGEVVGYAGIRLPSMEARLVEIEIRKVDYAGRG